MLDGLMKNYNLHWIGRDSIMTYHLENPFKQVLCSPASSFIRYSHTNHLLLFWFLDQQQAQEQVLELLPLVSEVNAVSEELDKQK